MYSTPARRPAPRASSRRRAASAPAFALMTGVTIADHARAPVWTRLCRMMTRRRFLHDAAVGSAAAFVPFQQPQAYKMGLQLFTIRALMSKDVAGTLKRIASLGYEEVETYGFDPQGLGYYGMPAQAFAQLLRDNNLTAPSGHYDLNRFVTTSEDDLKRYMDRCIEGAHVLGQA